MAKHPNYKLQNSSKCYLNIPFTKIRNTASKFRCYLATNFSNNIKNSWDKTAKMRGTESCLQFS